MEEYVRPVLQARSFRVSRSDLNTSDPRYCLAPPPKPQQNKVDQPRPYLPHAIVRTRRPPSMPRCPRASRPCTWQPKEAQRLILLVGLERRDSRVVQVAGLIRVMWGLQGVEVTGQECVVYSLTGLSLGAQSSWKLVVNPEAYGGTMECFCWLHGQHRLFQSQSDQGRNTP